MLYYSKEVRVKVYYDIDELKPIKEGDIVNIVINSPCGFIRYNNVIIISIYHKDSNNRIYIETDKMTFDILDIEFIEEVF